ncbi:7190_t:CDS:2 [Cetraspora pellucida]|uniref:7190_t:CDS:1 n=1 Tax=Cetraspora pellucida TaxID=1433469 RepID=A0ACA9KMX8_9GLOM|nr:7190_t:CDS:2 [Cetraspora pellucida]
MICLLLRRLKIECGPGPGNPDSPGTPGGPGDNPDNGNDPTTPTPSKDKNDAPPPSEDEVENRFNNDPAKQQIENNQQLTEDEKQAALKLLKTLISAEILIEKGQFNQSISDELLAEKNKQSTAYKTLNERIDGSFTSPNLSEEEIIQAISEGILFGTYQPINFKEKIEPKKSGDYYLITKNKKAAEILTKTQIKLAAVNFARDLQDAPPNKLRAKEFANQIKEKFSKLKNIEVEILEKKQITKNKMGLLLAVNAGSHHEPRVVILRYFGDKKNKNVLGLVGKGITFDSGGYNLKLSQYLQCMKFDMSGAAVVCASFLTLAQNKPKINVIAVACLTENAIGGHATLTESVITSMSGKTVEINNTDAEGRLVLADGITYAIQKEKANKIITVATLTGAVVAALGENLTELPITLENTKFLKENTTIADISNISSSRYMGASNGAAFLQEFVEKMPFIHCDIAGTA